jgi:dipeptidyl aminopeptidase/acylaminoacyl peptidase
VLGAATSQGGRNYTEEVVAIDVATGAERRRVPLPGMTALDAAWVDDTHALVNVGTGTRETQLSLLDLGTGAAVPITQNLAAFRGVGLTADRLAAVSTRLDQRSGIWIGDGAGGTPAEVVPETPARPYGVRLDNRGGLVYNAKTAVGTGIYSQAPGAALPALVVDDSLVLALTSDGRTVIFRGTRTGSGFNRVNVDGSGLASLAEGDNGAMASLTRDEQSVLFLSRKVGFLSLWVAPLAGGPGREIAHRAVQPYRLGVSPDGHRLLFGSRDASGRVFTVLCDLPECTNQKEVPVPHGAWTPDGRSVAYVDPTDPMNIQVQPIDGGAPHALTHFTEKNILDFAWSPDGKRLAITRGSTLADMVLIRGFK